MSVLSSTRTSLIASAIILLMVSNPAVPDEPLAELLVLEHEGRFTIRASQVPLPTVLRELSVVGGVDIRTDRRLDDVLVSLRLSDVTFQEALAAVSGSHAEILEKRGAEYETVSVLVTAEVNPVSAEDNESESAATTPYQNATEGTRGVGRDEGRHLIMLQNAVLDTREMARTGRSFPIPKEFEAAPDTRHHIVQFDRALDKDIRNALTDAGAVISHYIPQSAYAVRVDPDKVDRIRAWPSVQHIEPYHPYFKMNTDIHTYLVENPNDPPAAERVRRGRYNLVLFRGADAESFMNRDDVEIVSRSQSDGRDIITVAASPDLLPRLLRADDVQWIETTPRFEPMNDLAVRRVGATSLRASHPHLDGSGVTLNVTDTGIDFTNPNFAVDPTLPTSTNFNTRIRHYAYAPSLTSDGLPGDRDGHGTHVAGSILGNGWLSAGVSRSPGSLPGGQGPYAPRQFGGVAPGARIVVIEDFNSFTAAEQAETAYTQGARISNNSWGANVFEYGVSSMLWDGLTRDALPDQPGNQEYTVLFAAGNSGNGAYDGSGGIPGTVGQPGNAKNVISVGAVEQKRFADNLLDVDVIIGGQTAFTIQSDQQTDTDWQVAYFSGRGPVSGADRRVKPDIVAPGSYVLSVQSHETPWFDVMQGDPPILNSDYQYGNVDSGTNFAFFSGTSMATPIAAGAAALFYQRFTNLYARAPSPAMIKAAMVGGSRMLNSIAYKFPPNPSLVERVDQGWGLLDIRRAVDGVGARQTDTIFFWDQTDITPLHTGQHYDRHITVGPDEGGLKIVLAWTDVPGTPGNAMQLVNDLDLIVLAPDGGGYLGNRFLGDGVHSEKLANPDPSLGDGYNNVELVVIPEPAPGTYTIRVRGWQIPQGPQDFALAVIKGIGVENRHEGGQPAMDLDAEGNPVIAFSRLVGLNRQIHVKRWIGELGDRSQENQWLKMEDQWFSVAGSALGTGISQTLADSTYPTVAADGERIMVAWQEGPQSPQTLSRIYFKLYNGSEWIELNDSARHNGVSGPSLYDATNPMVAMRTNGNPVVAWVRYVESGEDPYRIFVAEWNGEAWIGLDHSLSNGLSFNGLVYHPRMIVDALNRPTITVSTQNRIRTLRWNGTSWQSLEALGAGQSATQPYTASTDDGRLLVAWIHQTTAGAGYGPYQVYAAIGTGPHAVTFTDLGGSRSYPGVSAATNMAWDVPRWPAIAGSSGQDVVVSWIAGMTNAVNTNSVRVAHYNGAAWNAYGDAADYPGIDRLNGAHHHLELRRKMFGIPVLAFANEYGIHTETMVYSMAADVSPPIFAGLRDAAGGTNGNVRLTWLPATDSFSTNIAYHIYQSPDSAPCWEVPNCMPESVFDTVPIAIVTNVTSYEALGLAPYWQHCYGVRAADEGGRMDDNMIVHFAAPKALDTEGQPIDCYAIDTDGDGMPDWWEYLHFGAATGGDAHAVMNPNGGLTNLHAYIWGTDPFGTDSDGDGLTDADEVYVYGTHPAIPDTDGDGIPDGMEAALGSDPRHWDSNANQVRDGHTFQLGNDNPADPGAGGYHILLTENFENGAPGWIKPSGNTMNFWHLSTAEPAPLPTVITSFTYTANGARITNTVEWLYGPPQTPNRRTPDTAYRFANDPAANNPGATYWAYPPAPLDAALQSPPVDASGAASLFLRWKEFHDTEPNKDFVHVQARSAAQPNWITVAEPRSGNSKDWLNRRVDLSQFAGDAGVEIRFRFTADQYNQALFTGWYVDDVTIYEAARIEGWVRDINGRPVVGATVRALGRGGVTNIVDGHQVVNPPNIFASATTAADGGFRIVDLPKGRYYVKAQAPGYRSEFYNGPIFTPPYAFGAGAGMNPGVFTLGAVDDALGYLDLTAPGAGETVHFELEPGDNRSLLGVAHHQPLQVFINNDPVAVWNGANQPGAAGFTPYLALPTLADLEDLEPDWTENPVSPHLFGALMEGYHRVGFGPDHWDKTHPRAPVRDGEITRVRMVDSVGEGYIQVVAGDGLHYPIYLNGNPTGQETPALFKAQAGQHRIHLAPNHEDVGVPPKEIVVPIGGRINVRFTTGQLSGPVGALDVRAVDALGAAIEGAVIRINGMEVPPGQALSDDPLTPAIVGWLRDGLHEVTVHREGYRKPESRTVRVNPGHIGFIQFAMTQSDEDYDGVGDATEIAAFGDIWSESSDGDPDGDGLSNLLEFEMFRLYGIVLDPGNHDTDGDGMSDSEEIGFNGYTHVGNHLMFAQSELAAPAQAGDAQVSILFRGRYLDGIDNFGMTNTGHLVTQVVASIAGDRFVASNIVHPPLPAMPTAQSARTVLTGIPSSSGTAPVSRSIRDTHPAGAPVFADTMPHIRDTSGDGMWDGFKHAHARMGPNFGNLLILCPLEHGGAHDDPDGDGLTNLQEFQVGTHPGNPDTDGDGMPDGWEVFYGLNPLDPDDAQEDPSGSGLTNLEEYYFGTNPLKADTDGDGLKDGEEVFGTLNPWKQDAFFPEFPGSTDPLNPDTDGDGLMDGLEILLGTNPNQWDTSGDGLSDGFCVLDPFGNLRPQHLRLNPLDPLEGARDASGDGMSNLENFLVRDGLGHFGQPPPGIVWDYWLDPFSTDSDGDGMPDVFEVHYGLHPMDPVPVGNGLLTRHMDVSARGDLDSDGLWNLLEYRIRFLLDADADPFDLALGTDPRNPDTDGDGLYDGEEWLALLSNPTKQDTDGDGLPDGSAGAVPGEVESTVRRHYELVQAPPGTTWTNAFNLAQNNWHPQGSSGRLATVVHPMDQETLEALLTPDVTRAAIGGLAIGNTDSEWLTAPMPRRHYPVWASSGQPYLRGSEARGRYERFADDQPLLPDPLENYGFVMGSNGTWSTIPVNDVVSHYLVEWNNIRTDTNHYDQAENDLWRLMYPLDAGKGLPYWERITPAVADAGLPPPRWGHAAVYVPVFEKKVRESAFFPRIAPGGTVLLDNRKIVIMGGRDGVSRYRDIWEYWIHDNTWRQSARDFVDGAQNVLNARNMDSGLSEFDAVLLQGYSNTRNCVIPPGTNPDGDGFGEPVNRPWRAAEIAGVRTGLRLWDTDFGDPRHHLYQQGSYDVTYVLGGWNERNQFVWNEPMDTLYYKSTDDPRPITEGSMQVPENAVDYFRYELAIQADGSLAVSTEHLAQSDPLPLGRLEVTTELELQGGQVISRTYTNVNVPVGIRFNRFPFGLCEKIAGAVLSFQVAGAAEPMTAFVVAEKNADGFSPANYFAKNEADQLIQTPSQRRTWPYASTNLVEFTIPAHFNGTLAVDVTSLVQEAVQFPWTGVSIGFVIYTDMDEDTSDRQALVGPGSGAITVSYVPSYKVEAEWRAGNLYQTGQDHQMPSRRKSFAMVYDYHEDLIVVFGGMDGMNVYNDTYLGQPRFTNTLVNSDGDYVNIGVDDPEPNARFPGYVRWKQVDTPAKPSPRWGHSMVYDDMNRRVVLFGGFNEQNRPLNDLWTFNTVDGLWQPITDFQDGQRPPPRGGAAMALHGGAYYQRGFSPADYQYRHRGRIVLFGGTDGRRYFNDTWVFDHHYDQLDGVIETGSSNRWILAVPGGEHAQAPSPRAFASMVFGQNATNAPDPNGAGTFAFSAPFLRPASGAVYLFGGRTGLLPSSRDTSGDLVEDGVAHAIGRDPRINTLIHKDTDQTPAFGYVRIGSHAGNMPVERAAVADFEVLSYLDRLHGWRHWSYTGTPIPYQGHPLETTIANAEFKIGDEEDWPVEDPDPIRTYYIVGVDAITPSWTNLWYHRARGGMRGDEGDGWQLGIPDNTALEPSAAPPTAYAGRWVYGTNLKGPYPNNAVMDLYSPVINLSLPSPQGTAPDSTNSYHLLFYEWLDLADPNDKVVVKAIRPSTPADVQTRQSGADRPPIVVVPERGYTANTTGQWRRVVASLDAVGQDPQVYLRFTLSSDASGNAGGWYIDNVAILQGGRIAGAFDQAGPGDPVSLHGVRSEMLVAASTIYDGGAFVFDMLPSGEYVVQSGTETYGPIVIDPNNPDPDLDPDFLLLNLGLNSDATIVWEAVEGRTYRIEYADTLNYPQQWTPLGANVTATNNPMIYFDAGPAAETRFYRVWLLPE